MRRAIAVYFAAMGGAVLLFGLGTQIQPGVDAHAWSMGAIRFLLLAAAAGCAITTWGAAIWIISNHRAAWPLALATGLVVATTIAFAATR